MLDLKIWEHTTKQNFISSLVHSTKGAAGSLNVGELKQSPTVESYNSISSMPSCHFLVSI